LKGRGYRIFYDLRTTTIDNIVDLVVDKLES